MNMQDEPRDEIFGQYEWQSWAFGNLREDYDFADVTLAFEDDQQAEAHKVILAGHWAEWGENQGCDLEVGKIMYPKITTLMSIKLKIMYIFQKIMY